MRLIIIINHLAAKLVTKEAFNEILFSKIELSDHALQQLVDDFVGNAVGGIRKLEDF